jgi:hypothetical protein
MRRLHDSIIILSREGGIRCVRRLQSYSEGVRVGPVGESRDLTEMLGAYEGLVGKWSVSIHRQSEGAGKRIPLRIRIFTRNQTGTKRSCKWGSDFLVATRR